MRKNLEPIFNERTPYGQNYRYPSPEHHYTKGEEEFKRVKSQTSIKKIVELETSNKPKKMVLEPGTPCEALEEIIGCTKMVDNNVTTYLLSKALKGPLLALASKHIPPPPQGPKEIPKTEEPISGDLTPHIPSYAVTTHEGVYRPQNEDKVSVVLDKEAKWFGIYDGHGGDSCSQYLKQHLHETFFRNKRWRDDPKTALQETFKEVDERWLETGNKAGSCCLVVLIVDTICYVANLGDSRAVLASDSGRAVYQITKDHKPSNLEEQKRVLDAGGKIYLTTAITEGPNVLEHVVGPLRVYPGRLSTTRTFGDIEAKDPRTDGNPNVVIAEPEITSFSISEHNFIIMGSDGLWDRLENKQCLKIAKQCLEQGISAEQFSSRACDKLLKEAMSQGSTDNISVTVIGLPGLQNFLDPERPPAIQLKSSKHIKVVNSIPNTLTQTKKKNISYNKENNEPSEKLKRLDTRINELAQNVQKLTGSR